MASKQVLKKFQRSLDDLMSITRAFEHTATKRMEVNRREIENISKNIGEAKKTYINAKISVVKKGREKFLKSAVRKTPKAKVVVLITSEPSYYGNLLSKMVGEFGREAQAGADAIIIGKPGKVEFDKINSRRVPYRFFDFSDDLPDWQVIGTISEIIKVYSQVNIIFARFQSILTQDVKNENVAQEVTNISSFERKKYLIQPEPESALSFLEKQILSSSLLQKLFENGLAKGAVRVRILEIGEIAQRLSESIERFEIFKRKVIRDINNRKLAGLYRGSSMWESESIFTVYR